MKTERLYAVTVYLLKHGRTSAGELAKHFEVSLRTIQRDIDSLCLAGIPVISFAGASGGYEISKNFQLDKQFATPEDYSHILTALQGLASATDDQKVKRIFDKINAVSPSKDDGMVLELSVLREGDERTLQLLQRAVKGKNVVRFSYTNNDNVTRIHSVEPIAVVYRWYAWYLLAYSSVKKDYRFYKLVRMRDLQLTDKDFERKHEAADIILQRTDQNDSCRYTDVILKKK